jgi:Mrp family chromosome partitioning ATPase
VLIDCPSLKESNEVLGLAPLVDGVLLVIEANRTSKRQVAYLERAIESAGGKILGHLLNKRTYPVPAWVHNKLESWGL